MRVETRRLEPFAASDAASVKIIDQTRLPHEFETLSIILFLKRRTPSRSCKYGRTAHRRDGGLWFGTSDARDASDANLDAACSILARRGRPPSIYNGQSIRCAGIS